MIQGKDDGPLTPADYAKRRGTFKTTDLPRLIATIEDMIAQGQALAQRFAKIEGEHNCYAQLLAGLIRQSHAPLHVKQETLLGMVDKKTGRSNISLDVQITESGVSLWERGATRIDLPGGPRI
jgi:hypothetical protein